MPPLLLDLFCGAGGAAVGYHRAGFEVVGVDIDPQPRYPFTFIQADALEYLADWIGERRMPVAAIHASPPCQAYSILGRAWPGREWPDLVDATRDLLEASGLPYVIENVPGSPLRATLLMCGGGHLPVVSCADGRLRQVRRHRYFEVNFPALGRPCHHPYPALGVYGNGRWSNDDSKHRGGYQGSKAENAEGMAIDWMTRDELSESIPPDFTQYVGAWLMAACADLSPAAP